MKKPAIIIVLIIILIALLMQGYFIFREKQQLKKDLDDSKSRLESLGKENSNLRAELDYLAKPENLEKELKSKFNYRRPEEKMMIIVP